MTGLLNRFRRVRKGQCCPVCERPDWCLIEPDSSGDPVAVLCQRTPSAHRWGDAGFYHPLQGRSCRTRPRRPATIVSSPRRTFGELTGPLARDLDLEALSRLAVELGVSSAALQRLGIGYAHGAASTALGLRGGAGAFTFPMLDHRGRVIGVRLRLNSGKKLSVKGSAVGLFVPTGLVASGTVFIAEGESDTSVLLTLRVEAIGRPSATSCAELIVRYAREAGMHDVVVVADRDEVGQRGATHLARQLARVIRHVRLITPPAKDARQWLRSGASPDDLQALAEHAPRISRVLRQSGGAA